MAGRAVVTGGAGFFGRILLERLLADGWHCLSIDRLSHEPGFALSHPQLVISQCDIRDRNAVSQALNAFGREPIDAVFHCAAVLAHGSSGQSDLWSSNVDGTRTLLEVSVGSLTCRVRTFVFVSTNCLWGAPLNRPVRENEPANPVEPYGRSKLEAESIVQHFSDRLACVRIRTPTIIDRGRLGLLTLLFDFIKENRKVWVVGRGDNRYQFIHAPDLADACIRAALRSQTDVFNVGAGNVVSLRDTFEQVIGAVGSSSRVVSLPRDLALFTMRLAHGLGLSPLGPYHYRMIAESFEFDTAHARAALGWAPTLTGGEMLTNACRYYFEHFEQIHARTSASPHRRAAGPGIIRLLKWLS
jgi:nucleoside-diphosphate-sugar epimerase